MERNRKWGESRVFAVFDATSPPLSPFNREPVSPDKATCNLSQLVLFTVSRFSASVLHPSPPPIALLPLYFSPSVIPFCFFHPLFCFPESSEANRVCVRACTCVCVCVSHFCGDR